MTTDNLIPFGRRDKEPPTPTGYQPLEPSWFQFTFKNPDGTNGTYKGLGVIKMNGPLLVFTPVDNELTTLQDASFFVLFEHLYYGQKIEAPEVPV